MEHVRVLSLSAEVVEFEFDGACRDIPLSDKKLRLSISPLMRKPTGLMSDPLAPLPLFTT